MSENFARGRSAEVRKLDDNKVMKLFFEGFDKAEAEKEYKNTKIAFEQGCTKTKVYDMVEEDGRSGFVMDYIDGICQNDMPGKNPFYIFKAGTDLADMHALVHSKKSHDLDDIRQVCIDKLNQKEFDELTQDEKKKAKKYINSLEECDTIIHLDFHTGNTLVDNEGKCHVIDWMTAARGSRAVEYAMMEFLFSDAELFPEKSKFVNSIFGLIRGMIGKEYYKEYQKIAPISKEEVDKYRLLALIVRRSWGIEFERANLINKIKALIEKYC